MDALKREKEARLRRNEDEFGEEGERARLALEGYHQGKNCRIRIDYLEGQPGTFRATFEDIILLSDIDSRTSC